MPPFSGFGIGRSKTKPKEGDGFTQIYDARTNLGSGGDPVPPVAATSVAAACGNGIDRVHPPTLKELMRKRILTDICGAFHSDVRGAAMLVDALTVRILSTAMKMSELIDEHQIHLVENITMRASNGHYLRRQPLPAIPGIYFITPTVESVNRFLDDFKDKKAPMYASAHLYFTSRLPDVLLAKIKKEAHVLKAVASFKELNLEFATRETNMFTLESPKSLAKLFGDDVSSDTTKEKMQEQHRIANSLATLFVTLGEMPLIRFPESAPRAAAIAAVLQEKLDAIAGSGCGFPSRMLPDSEWPLLLILDRSFDPLTPLLHEYSYEAMTHDLLQIQGERYKYHYVSNNNQRLTKEVLLNETDPLWVKYRHAHIADLVQTLHSDYNQFLLENKDAAELNKKEQDMKAMRAGLAGVHKFQEETARYSMHINIADELLHKYNAAALEQVSALEQCMACGEETNTKPYRTAMADVRALLGRKDVTISPEDRMRLVMIYIITQENIKLEERRMLLDEAEIDPEDQVAILALFNMGVSLQQGLAHKKTKKKEGKPEVNSYDISRYVPPLRRLLEEAALSTLSLPEYPYVKPPSATGLDQVTADLRGNKLSSWASAGSKPKGATAVESAPPGGGRRVVVFIVGGATYSECREMHTASADLGRDFILGSTDMLTPRRFVLDLKEMKPLASQRSNI